MAMHMVPSAVAEATDEQVHAIVQCLDAAQSVSSCRRELAPAERLLGHDTLPSRCQCLLDLHPVSASKRDLSWRERYESKYTLIRGITRTGVFHTVSSRLTALRATGYIYGYGRACWMGLIDLKHRLPAHMWYKRFKLMHYARMPMDGHII